MKHRHSLICSLRKRKGFTLIELLVAIAITGIVLAVVGQFFISTNKTYTIQEKVADTQQSIRAIMEMISRDIRMAGLNPEDTAGDAGFVTDSDGTTATSVAFAYDYSNDSGDPISDGACNDDREYVCYSFASANQNIMYRWSNDGGGSWQAGSLTENGNIASLNFEYLDRDGNTTGNLDNIRQVVITICGEISGAYAEDLTNDLCFSNTVKCRNM